MNLVEKYVYNITSTEEINYRNITLYKIKCDTDCYGGVREHVTILLTKREYNMVKEKGYYMC